MIVEAVAAFGRNPALEAEGVALDARALADRVAESARALRGSPLVECTGEPTVANVVRVLGALEAEVPLLALHPRFPPAVADALRAEVLRALDRLDPARAAALAQLVPTSGSTGTPRAVGHARAGITSAARRSAQALGIGPGSRVALGLPLGHVSGLSQLARTLLSGGCLVVPRADEARAPLAHAAAHAITHVSLVPTQLARALEDGPVDPAALTRVVVGGAACDAALVQAARARGLPVVRTYGMTETYAMVALEPIDGDGAGVPLHGVALRIEHGRIAVAVDSLATAVVSGGDCTPLAHLPDGAFLTADLGAVRPDGALVVYGRADDVVLTGGENVHPAEVEAVLEAVPGVVAACVVGVPDAVWGARLVALVEAKDAVDEALVRAALDARLPAFARPKTVVRVTLPRTASGKVDRAAARRMAAAR